MSYAITPPAESLLRPRQSLRLARLWWLRRADNVNLRFTDHDHELVGPDGATYTPLGGFDPSAIQRAAALEEQNFDIRGVLSDDAITDEDLFAGRYEEAEVNEYVVDWLYPWAGTLQHARYWITETTHDGESWTARVSGIPYWLRFNVGGTFSRNCDADLGDARCKVNLTTFQQTGLVDVVIEDRLEFDPNDIATADVGYHDDGEVRWLTGANAGLTSQVRTYAGSPRTLRLYLRTPHAIVAGDSFVLSPGCDKTGATCTTKYSNRVNFRGFEFLPGTDKLLETPTS